MKPWILCLAMTVAILTLRAGSAGQGLPRHSLERFDTVDIPLLPAGWMTTSARDPDGDFVTTASGASSAPGCAVSSNATVRQSLTSPPLDLARWRECSVAWNERRSASHDASLALEASADGGTTFVPVTIPPLPPSGGTIFVPRAVPLPAWTGGAPDVRLRWTVGGDGSGPTGTIRLDDILVSGTPARDLSIALDTTSPRRPLPGAEVRSSGRIVNNGTESAEGPVVTWAVDADGDGVPSPAEFSAPVAPGPVSPGDTALFGFAFVRDGPGALTLIAIVGADSDMVPSNDTAAIVLPPAAAPGSVVITEIMYDPLQGLPEYVEIYNRSGAAIAMGGWRLVDEEDDSTGGALGGVGALLLGPGEYLVCSPDTTLRDAYPLIPPSAVVAGGVRGLSLNNGGDLLLLLDESGGEIDRVAYSPSWHTPALEVTQGRSLERVDPGSAASEGWNWGTSAGSAGGTPGGPNSLRVIGQAAGGELDCSPNPFSPDGDGFEDVTLISYRPGSGPALARVRVYDVQGRLVRTLTAGGYIGAGGSFAWNGYDDLGRKAPIGIYVVVVDTVDGDGGGAAALRAVVVVGGKL